MNHRKIKIRLPLTVHRSNGKEADAYPDDTRKQQHNGTEAVNHQRNTKGRMPIAGV